LVMFITRCFEPLGFLRVVIFRNHDLLQVPSKTLYTCSFPLAFECLIVNLSLKADDYVAALSAVSSRPVAHCQGLFAVVCKQGKRRIGKHGLSN
jgi:hypothetical protein